MNILEDEYSTIDETLDLDYEDDAFIVDDLICEAVFDSDEDIHYECSTDYDYGGLTVEHYTGMARDISMPSYDEPITTIGHYAFEGHSCLINVNVPNTVKKIGNYAFYNCVNLESIKIPNSVIIIGNDAFRDCCSLISVVLPSRLKEISPCTFWNCTNLEKVKLPNSIVSIHGFAFKNCRELRSITIPYSVVSIGSNVFSDCSKLTKIIFTKRTNLNGIELDKDWKGNCNAEIIFKP